jgi:hypothetical protein
VRRRLVHRRLFATNTRSLRRPLCPPLSNLNVPRFSFPIYPFLL